MWYAARMALDILGCGPAWPHPGRASSGYIIADEHQRVLVDCGHGVMAQLLARMSPVDLDALVISHRHADHCADLLALAYHLRFVSVRPEPLPVYAHADVLAHLPMMAQALGAEASAWSVFDLRALEDEQTVGAWTLRSREVPHFVPVRALAVAGADWTIGYTADCGYVDGAPPAALMEIISGADLLLAEATMPEGQQMAGHLGAEQAGRIAQEAGVGHLILTHYAQEISATLVARAQTAFSGQVSLAEPGALYWPR